MPKNNDEKIRSVADSAILVFTSRISAPLLVAICSWIGITIINVKTDLAQLTGTVTASFSGIANRVDDLESWKNSIASDVWGRRNGKQSN